MPVERHPQLEQLQPRTTPITVHGHPRVLLVLSCNLRHRRESTAPRNQPSPRGHLQQRTLQVVRALHRGRSESPPHRARLQSGLARGPLAYRPKTPCRLASPRECRWRHHLATLASSRVRPSHFSRSAEHIVNVQTGLATRVGRLSTGAFGHSLALR
jgi:hypothetical protein